MVTNKMVKNIQSKLLSKMKILKLLIIALFISTNCIAHETTYNLYKNKFSKFNENLWEIKTSPFNLKTDKINGNKISKINDLNFHNNFKVFKNNDVLLNVFNRFKKSKLIKYYREKIKI